MAYLKPPFFVSRIFNPLAMRFGLGGTVTLAVPGRTSGETLRVPLIPVTHDGARYLVSTRGESDWVRNLRTNGEAVLTRKGATERIRATEVATAERPAIIAAYQAVAGKTVDRYFAKLPDPSDHPTFRIEPAAS